MNKAKRICLLGGTGFVGKAIVRQLAQRGHHVLVPSRRRERHRELLVLPTVDVVDADIHDTAVLQKLTKNTDVLINLIGILNEHDRKTRNFNVAHVVLARKVVDACHVNRIPRLLHMSALKSDANRGLSKYLRSKGEAENIIHTTKDLAVSTFRPSVIFGPDDQFLNRFATLFKLSPRLFPLPLACAKAKFAPVYVEDVARTFVLSIDDKATFGQRYNLCGPKQYTLEEIVKFIANLMGQKRLVLPLGSGLSQLQAIILGMLPGKLLTTDNVLSMRVDCVCENSFPNVFGFQPASLEMIAPRYIAQQHTRGQFDSFRATAGRD